MKNRIIRLIFLLSGVIFWISLPFVVTADTMIPETVARIGGYGGAVLGLIGMAIAGYLAGKSYDGYTGWERFTHGAGQFFNRTPFKTRQPTYGITDATQRPGIEELLFSRMGAIFSRLSHRTDEEPSWTPDQGPSGLNEPYASFFKREKEKYDQAVKSLELIREQQQNWPRFQQRYKIIDAWSAAMGSLFERSDGQMIPNESHYPQEPDSPPEEWDFRGIREAPASSFKSDNHAAELIKKVTHTFGATLVGVTRLNPDWCYQGHLRGVGDGNWEVPDHWKYAIVYGVPHEWDQFYANPTYGSSFDGYSNARIIAGRLEAFIHNLGYPARCHVPPAHYDIMLPPVAVDAGLGEQSRMGILLTPELGANVRLGCVTTSLPMKTDSPIDFGVQKFCKKCKICVRKCPSGAISPKDEPDIEFGYKRWRIRDELCFNTWASVAASKVSRGCRICMTVCPYSRKNTWIHALSRVVDSRDPTGIVSSSLLWAQNKLFDYPKARDFMPPPKGKNATYHQPPDWLKSENWLNIHKDWS